ncbi:MAG: dUTP diphosphatase [Mycoplasma sp.]
MLEINLSDLFAKQEQLDQHIHQNHHLTYKDVEDELVLALAVELSELANEIRCFKFWSNKKPSDKDVILEEYVDGIHFITSIAIAKHLAPGEFIVNDTQFANDKKAITKIFNQLYSQLNYLYDAEHVKEWYEQYLSLGYALGFNIDEIKTAYNRKNAINHNRQDTNY